MAAPEKRPVCAGGLSSTVTEEDSERLDEGAGANVSTSQLGQGLAFMPSP